MLAYLSSKAQFLEDAHIIEDLVRDAVKENLGIGVSQNEYASWRNSLGNGMSHIISSPEIPEDAGIAIEYQLNKLKTMPSMGDRIENNVAKVLQNNELINNAYQKYNGK